MKIPSRRLGGRPFPARVRWLSLWRNRWILLDLLNQIAHGTVDDAIVVTDLYGGDSRVGLEVYAAARESIEVVRGTGR